MRSAPAAVARAAAVAFFVVGCVPDTPRRVPSADDCGDAYAFAVEARGRRGGSIRGGPPIRGGRSTRGVAPTPVGATGPLGSGRAGRVDDPAAAAEGVEMRTPVRRIGDWVIRTPEGDVVVVDDGEPRVICVEGDGSSGVGVRSSLAVPEAQAVTFTDADLRAALDAHPRGVAVYVWSPHMPLSVDGYAELAEAGESRGLTVLPVLFAGSDTAFARREAERVGLPPAALRVVASAELVFRDAQVHAPTVMVFRPGSASPVMPGYRDAAGYRSWLDALGVGA